MSDFAEFNTETVVVETYNGGGGMGSAYDPGVTYDAVQVDETRKLVKDEVGDTVVSEASIYDDDLTHEARYRPRSRVTLPSGRQASVISVKALGPLGVELPAHLEVNLT